MRKWILTLALVLFVSGAAANTVTTGNKLLAKCQSEIGALTVWCSGYLQGATDAEEARVARGDSPRVICIEKESISTKQLREPVIAYLESHPQELEAMAAGELVLNAYKEAFPCE